MAGPLAWSSPPYRRFEAARFVRDLAQGTHLETIIRVELKVREKARMRLLYVNPYLIRFNFWTGERGRQLVRELRAAGATVSTFPVEVPENRPDGETRPRSIGRLKALLKARMSTKWFVFLIEYHLLLRGVARTLSSGLWVWRRRREIAADLVLARTFEYDWTPWVVSRLLNLPLVLEIHAPFYIERQLRGRKASRLWQWFECIQWRRAVRLWVHTRELESIIAGSLSGHDSIRVIPFGVNMIQTTEEDSKFATDSIQVIFTGSFYTWHGVEALLEAFAQAYRRVGKLRLCLVGDGVVRAAAEQQARAMGLERVIEFTGWLSQEKVAERLRRADIGVAPYLKLEPFYFEPVKVLDYMAAGLAIVASDQGQTRELLKHGESGLLVPPGGVSALADALVALGEDRGLRERLGRNARARAPTWQMTARHVLAVCQEAIESSAG